MYLESLTIDQLMDTIANWDNWEGEVVSVSPIPPAICYDEAPESQNDANLFEEGSEFGMAPPGDENLGWCPRCGSGEYYRLPIFAGGQLIDVVTECLDCGY
jgi:hypothetical protein